MSRESPFLERETKKGKLAQKKQMTSKQES
jgi:hypothetical protein